VQEDALPSNAGDRYHFVYAARRMLDMLHPRSDLVLVEMENVAKEDLQLASEPETFLGVDLTEYYGGTNSDAAERVVVVQVKYSPTHPTERWTLNRLCADKTSSAGGTKPGSSVLRKLANAFNAFYSKLGDATAGKFAIKLHTNQRLDEGLEAHLRQAKALVVGLGDMAGGRALSRASGELKAVLDTLQRTTNLPWKRLAAFINCWDVGTFGQAMLSTAEAELFTAANQYRSDSDVFIDRLISFVQDHASSNRPTSITREQVYAQLRLREADFFPAPARFEQISGLLFTEAARQIIQAIEETDGGLLLVHGVSGTGKSTTMRLVSQHYGGGGATVIYDCYAGGAGLQLGSERFPYDRCFVQVTNELDSLLHTNILSTTTLNFNPLVTQFNKALERAAQLAAQRGHRLVVAFDAVDNAVTAAERSPLKGEQSFVPMLWNVAVPANCVLLVTARTENLPRLNIPGPYREVQIGGFSAPETAQYVKSFWADATDELLKHVHLRTRGNPRVQSKLIEAVEREPATDLFKFVEEKARETAFDYYAEACPERLVSPGDRLILGVLLEAELPLSLGVLTDITRRPAGEVRIIIDSLYFGLHTDREERISWADQDFFDYAAIFAADVRDRALDALADYCRQHYETAEYAKAHLSRHLFLAGRYGELVDWWLQDNRLASRIAEATPYEEDVLTDAQYALLASVETGRFAGALRLLAIAADVKQGRDIFSAEVKKHTDIAVECGYVERLIEALEEAGEHDLPSDYFRIARSLSSRAEKTETVKDLISRGSAIIKQERNESSRREGGFSYADVLNIGVSDANIGGLVKALERMQDWKPQEAVHHVYGSLTRTYGSGRGEEVLTAVESAKLAAPQRAYALLGLLSARKAQLEEEALRALAEETHKNLEDGTLGQEPAGKFIPAAVLNLLERGLREEAKKLLPRWSVRPPYYQHDPNILSFLKVMALREVLGVEEFDPEAFGKDTSKGAKGQSATQGYEEDYHRRNLREELGKQYPAVMCWAKALVRAPQEEVIGAVDGALKRWTGGVGHWWYEPQFSFIGVADLLLQAITLLPDYHGDTVARILETAEEVLAGTSNHGYHEYADVLSSDGRYLAQAERLINNRRREVRPPEYRASEAVQALLDLYPPTARFDRELAFDIFTDARLAATEWDGNIGGRAFALLKTAYRAQPEVEINAGHLGRMAAVFEYMKKVAFEDTNPRLGEALRLLARIQPSFALDVLRNLGQSGVLDVDEGIGPVGVGMMEAGHAPAQAVWGLTHSIDPSGDVEEVFFQVIPRLLAAGQPVDAALDALTKHLRVGLRQDLRPEWTSKFLSWAETQPRLGNHAAVTRMRDFFADLEALGLAEREHSYRPMTDSEDSRSALFAVFLAEAQKSPEAAWSALMNADDEEVKGLYEPEVEEIVDRMASTLASARITDLLGFIEKWSNERLVPKEFTLVIRAAERMAGSTGAAGRVNQALAACLERLLTPVALRQLSREYYQEHLSAVLACPLLALAERVRIVLSAVTDSLRELSADEIYWLIGNVGELLPAPQAFEVFDTLLNRAVHKLPAGYVFEQVSAAAPVPALIRFVSDLLGHPRQVVRWRALYSLVDIALNVPDPVLGLMADELRDEDHGRWMTKREWLLLALHHISVRSPALVEPLKDVFVPRVLNAEFPHAKFRYHAREILLNIEKHKPGALPRNVLEAIRAVNEPKEFIERPAYGIKPSADEENETTAEVPPREQKGALFTFDKTDTLPYWYSPLANCFALRRGDVADIAYKWIVEKWHITDKLCREERQVKRYNYEDSSHRHGSEPAVETLSLYAERHGMFMAAGELVDSEPVVHIGEREGDRWYHWMRYRLRAVDPALTGRLNDAPPLTGDNYGVFTTDFERWRKKEDEEDFQRELTVPGKPDWIVVGNYRTGTFGERSFTTWVKSALISRQTAQAFVRLVESQDEYVDLPDVDAHYDTTLTEFEHDLTTLGDYYIVRRDEIKDESGLFRLKAWLADWHQEMPSHDFDPKWREHGRNFYMPDLDFTNRLGLHRPPISLQWFNASGECVAYHENWYDHEETKHDYSGAAGHRLIVHRDHLVSYLQAVGMDMIFIVKLSRHRPYSYRRHTKDGEESEYDTGTRRAFVLTQEGRLG
jgi:hypothetical protein